MKTLSTLAVAILLGAAPTAPAFAAGRAWVSSTGTDSGTCLVAAPCRSFQYAHDQVDAGGEIDVKDSGGYGTLKVTKSIAVVAPEGVLATMTVPGTSVALELAIGANDIVLLRGLTINGTKGTLGIGIHVSTGRVTIDHCSIKGAAAGISVNGNAATMITNNILTGNTYGIDIEGGFSTGIGGNVITNNIDGIINYSTSAYSYGDNKINGNISADFSGNQVLVFSMR